MTESDLNRFLSNRLQEAGIGKDDVDKRTSFLFSAECDVHEESPLFSTPEGFLAEIVLRDASKLEKAEKAVEKAQRELERERVSLLPTVRALWRVKQGSVTPRFDVSSLRDFVRQHGPSLQFEVTVQSGPREERVWVEVTPQGYADLDHKRKCDIDTLKRVVEAWVNSRLEVGGASHWDPRRDRWRQIDAGGVSYVFAYNLVA